MTEIQRKQKIWEELIAEAKSKSEARLDNEFTLREFCEDSGMRRDKARNFLEEKIREGTIKLRKTKRIHYYSLV